MANQPGEQRKRSTNFKPFGTGMITLAGEMSEETKQMAIRYQFIYSSLGLVLGLVCMVLGTLLFFNGIGVGSSSWTAKILGISSQISDAGPGLVLFIIGLFSVFLTKFDLRVKR